jgi:hypothetical protein
MIDDNHACSPSLRKTTSAVNFLESRRGSQTKIKKTIVESDKRSRRDLGGTLMYQSPESKKF